MRNAPDVIAKIRLLPTSEGGRTGATPEDRFNCIMTIGEKNFDVRLDLHRTGALRPGQEAIVPVSFYDPEFAKNFIQAGQGFKLREARVIGDGFIEEVWLTS